MENLIDIDKSVMLVFVLGVFVGILIGVVVSFWRLRRRSLNVYQGGPRSGFSKKHSLQNAQADGEGILKDSDSFSQTPKNTVDDLRNESSLFGAIQGVPESLNNIETILRNIETILQGSAAIPHEQVRSQIQDSNSPESKVPSTRPQGEGKPHQPFQSESGEPESSVLQELCDLYNKGDEREWMNFRNHHPPYRIGITNATERQENRKNPPCPIFQSQNAGRFWAYHIESEKLYAVLPSYDLVLQDQIYSTGAFGEVFECPDFNPEHKYHVKVIQPALFEPDQAKEKWTLQKKGKLKLVKLGE